MPSKVSPSDQVGVFQQVLAGIDHLGGQLVQDLRYCPPLKRRQVRTVIQQAEVHEGLVEIVLFNIRPDLLLH